MNIIMNLFVLFGVFALILVFVMFFTDIFPRCSICRKIKFRAFIRIHEASSMLPGYRKSKTACRKCCKKYNVSSFKEYQQLYRIKKRLEI